MKPMKNTVQERLGADHRNTARLLTLMAREAQRVRSALPADIDLMREVMRYLTSYSDKVHHPLEDLMFESLADIEPAARDAVARMEREHTVLAASGARLFDSLQIVADGAMASRDDIVNACDDYIESLRAHMSYENETVFPYADRALDEATWRAIAARFEAEQDPVFGPVRDADYADLLAYIERESA